MALNIADTLARLARRRDRQDGINTREAERRAAHAQHQARMSTRHEVRHITRGLWLEKDSDYHGHPEKRRKALRQLRRQWRGL